MADDVACLQRLEDALRAAPETLRERSRNVRARCLLGFGEAEALLHVDSGQFCLQTKLPPLTQFDFALRGSARGWQAYWEPMPAPGWHDLFALAKRGELRIEGELLPFMRHLQFFKDLLALPRGAA